MNKLTILLLYFISLNGFAKSPKQQASGTEKKNEYTVAAYVWPSCHNEPIVKEALWSEGMGEWEIIEKGTPKFEGHYQPRLPLWGYRMNNDPLAWEQKISAASDYGVNTFIFDWYWYNGKPLLEEALDNGFLGAQNTEKMNFYVMWANHKVDEYQRNHFRYTNGTVLWPGTVDWDNYKTIVDRVRNGTLSYRFHISPMFPLDTMTPHGFLKKAKNQSFTTITLPKVLPPIGRKLKSMPMHIPMNPNLSSSMPGTNGWKEAI